MKSNKLFEAKVLENINLDEKHYILKLELSEKPEVNPGEFFMAKCWGKNGPVLNRPFSVFNYNNGILDFFIRKKGIGTELFSQLEPGDSVELIGPLGNGFRNCENYIAVGAGMGIAPINYAAEKFNLDVVYGINNVISLFEFDKKGFKVCSLDGSCGIKGDAFSETITKFNNGNYKGIIACGPDGFLDRMLEYCVENKISAQLSYEERMGCGTGFCMSCVRKIGGATYKICTDGPVIHINMEE